MQRHKSFAPIAALIVLVVLAMLIAQCDVRHNLWRMVLPDDPGRLVMNQATKEAQLAVTSVAQNPQPEAHTQIGMRSTVTVGLLSIRPGEARF